MGHRFEKPPIHELVIGMAFRESLFNFHSYSKFYEKIKIKYPTVEEREAIFHPQFQNAPNLNEIRLTPESSVRYWFISLDGSRLIQLQNNCFYLNWRRDENKETEYPSFKILFSEFESIYNLLSELVNRPDLEKSAEFELTYNDHLYSNAIAQDFSNIGKVIKLFNANDFVKDINGCSIRYNKKLKDFKGIYDVNIQSARNNKISRNVLTVNSSIRGKLTDKANNYCEWFKLASYFVVEDFVNLLTNDARKEFGYYVSK